jgi:hypothetical protein
MRIVNTFIKNNQFSSLIAVGIKRTSCPLADNATAVKTSHPAAPTAIHAEACSVFSAVIVSLSNGILK